MILVLGAGRTGTSQTAQILHKLGINMGEDLIQPDTLNPDGYFEDWDFVSLDREFFNPTTNNVLWNQAFENLIESRQEPWGLKELYMTDHPSLLKKYLDLNPHIILCTRPYEPALESMKKLFKRDIPQMKEEEVKNFFDNRLRIIKTALKNKDYLEIKCHQPIEEKEKKIKKWLQDKDYMV